MPSSIKTLDDLYEAIKSGALEMSADLPTFGGKDPADTQEIWSWDETRFLVGTCPNDLEIMARAEWDANREHALA